MYLQFKNSGLIDELVFKSFGVSIKDNDNPIGFFGTGLKYAIAVITRHRGHVMIYSGDKEYIFSSKYQSVRGKIFEFISCNDEILGYTTDLGKQWDLWMAYRELYSNCKDENGTVSVVRSIKKPKDDSTAIYVNCSEMVQIHKTNNPKVFLDTTPIYSNEQIEIHPGIGRYLYYKGIRVYDLPKLSSFTYNLLEPIDLTEDRTIKYSFEANRKITKGIIKINDNFIFNRIFKDPNNFECCLDYDHPEVYFDPSFIDLSIQSYKKDPNSIPLSLYSCIIKFNRNINQFESINLDNRDRLKLDRAIEFCKKIDFDPSDYKIIVVKSLGSNVLAMALRDHNQIIISKTLFDMGLKQLISGIVEEVVHLREGLNDYSRSLQTYLFDKIITIGEKYTGDCL